MCLNPITIPNQSKYISLRYSDPYLMQVPCGHCAECQTTIGNQYYYRAWYEWKNCKYVLFDTLTYNNDSLPHLSETWSMLPKELDFPCFDYTDVRNFLQTLRLRLIRKGYKKDSLRYFLSSEYGTSEYYQRNGRLVRATHRPHYHVLFYVQDNRIDPLWLSKQIADVWKHGRTDGLPYKTASYVLGKNYMQTDCDNVSKLRTCRYVTKYVQKSCKFDEEIYKRIAIVMRNLSQLTDNPDEWLESEYAHRERLKLLRFVGQFHRQSQQFGAAALGDIDLLQLYKTGCLFMPDTKGIVLPVPLPTYYKRKMFYELVEFNGSRYWVKNELGLEYDEKRKDLIKQRLVDRYKCLILDYHLNIDVDKIADYVLYKRGRIKAHLPSSTLLERSDKIDLFNYVTSSDKLQFGCRGLSPVWLGDTQQGYSDNRMRQRLAMSSFIQRCVYMDEECEKELSKIIQSMQPVNNGKQNAYRLRQALSNTYKMMFTQ